MDKIYTIGQAAQILSLSERTILRHIKSGKLNAYKGLNGQYRIEESQLRIFAGLEPAEPPIKISMSIIDRAKLIQLNARKLNPIKNTRTT